ncbi:alpha/beta fold hydrolase [Aquisediminimonas profunda]|uniref:alpha/beta fold hydrolase n=1 Tax=Aquisediminimonas profunda TaxID=1550733 RepID=UPI001C627110|nr:alpha/beta fold hydrolase [Aquisediminimonas profunda]
MDVLGDILASLNLTGGVVIDAELGGDWCLASQFTPRECAPYLTITDSNLIAYHYVREGHFFAEVAGLPPIEAKKGDILLMPRNDLHLLYSGPSSPPLNTSELIQNDGKGPAKIRVAGPGTQTSLYCGFLGTVAEQHPLLDALPPILKLAGGESARSEWVQSGLRLLNEEEQSPQSVSRLSELFLAETIRAYLEELPEEQRGWLSALRDPAVARALTIIHSRYAEDLDVETLAREAGVSRTILGEKFSEMVGESPMRYAARWRMRIAANLLREGKENTANIAYSVGFNSEAAFNRAFKREYGEPPATWRRLKEIASPLNPVDVRARFQERITHCTAADGARLAYAEIGEGFPLVKVPNWVTHLEHDWDSPVYGHWISECARNNRFIRADMRGFGLSDWTPPQMSFETFVSDLETVINDAGIDQCDLLGISHGAAIAVAYAARNPERVRKLVLVNSVPEGWKVRADPEEIAWRNSLLALNQQEHARRRSVLGEMFITLYFPSAGRDLIEWHNAKVQLLASDENIQKMLEIGSHLDVRRELEQVSAETLVCHSQQDGQALIRDGRRVARAIRGARFVELESANHVLLGDEPAWPIFVAEFRRFLGHRSE